ncbi:MAG: VOC family protein [Beutenbergiaceae bacterium]
MPVRQHPEFGFDHLGLTVPDLEVAVEFFTRHLGAEVEFTMDRFVDSSGDAPARLGAPRDASFALAMLRIGTTRVELLQWWRGPDVEQPDGADRVAPGPHAPGCSHLALSVQDAGAAYRELVALPGVRACGGPVTFGEGPTPGLTNAFVQTPWGLLIELMSWPAASGRH